MSLQVAKTKKREFVVTNLEIFLLFFSFLGILFLLFPKESLQKQVLAEKSNFDLTAIYLKNLMKLNPEDNELILVMAKTLYQQKKYDLAINLLKILNDNPDKKISQDATLLHIKINNTRLKVEKDSSILQKIKDENSKLLKSVIYNKYIDKNSSKTLYHAAITSGDKTSALKFNRNILDFVKGEERIKWFKNYHYLASDLNEVKEDIYALKILTKEDKNESKMWLNSLIPLLDKNIDLENLASDLSLDKEALANLYILKNRKNRAILIYKQLHYDEKNLEKREKLFIKLIDMYKASNNTASAAKFAKVYENEYKKNSHMTNILLKLYLEANRADFAKDLSLKIIKQKGIK